MNEYHEFEPLHLNDGTEMDLCAECGRHKSEDRHLSLVSKLRRRADTLYPENDDRLRSTRSGSERRDAAYMREAADEIERLNDKLQRVLTITENAPRGLHGTHLDDIERLLS